MSLISKSTFVIGWLNTLLAPRGQEGDNNWLLGLIILLLGIALFVVFWQWWKTVEAEDAAVDLRLTNAHPAQALTQAGTAADRVYQEHEDAHIYDDDHTRTVAVDLAADTAVASATEAATQPEPEPVIPDDLTKIEGIGPKISELLQAADIATFSRLAQTEINQLQQILEEAGSRYRLADPETWPQQAGLAAAGKWDDLEALQEDLKGGRTEE